MRGRRDDEYRAASCFLDAVERRDIDGAAECATSLTARFPAGRYGEISTGLRWLVRHRANDATAAFALCRVRYAMGDVSSYRTWLDHAARCAAEHATPEAVRLDIDVECAFAAARFDGVREVHALNQLRSRAATVGGPHTMLQLDETEATAMGQSPDLAEVRVGCQRATELVDDWLRHGDPERAAGLVRSFGSSAMTHLGWYRQVLELLDRIPVDGVGSFGQAGNHALLARMAAVLGLRERFDALRPPAGELPSWVEAYQAWSAMILAGLDGDLGAVRRFHSAAVERFDSVALGPTGAILECEAAVALCRAGAPDEAAELLQRLGARAGACVGDHDLARLTVSVAADPSTAPTVLRDLALVDLPTARTWPVMLACAQASDDRELRRRAVDDAVAAGHESLLRRLTVDPSGARVAKQGSVGVSLLGGAHVVAHRDVATFTAGRVLVLLSRLVLDRRTWTREELADHLDPDGDGRRALRNAMHELRRQTPPNAHAAVTADATTVSLGSWVTTDIDRFEAADGLARVHAYGGPLLPHRLYDDWLQPHRTRFDRLFGEALLTAVRLGDLEVNAAVDLAKEKQLACPRALEALGAEAVARGAGEAGETITLRLHDVLS